ncbi:MAG: ribonuclease P [Candidatus Parvarchaeota archaeon]|nr:ribonuclease P [Candidatus Jingweiarchaeum tengchongense]MCW1298221.1 ribonuclease P [Candidatus Jingweiarchaeum tengchongense]MCW1300019.1 ribonuclease P [Candidatus Jingweiarchaeum tengchongense]MCW1304842.1 ribonuclease P [Candidatus Jingweiarchaeum tengchongense]MCW1305432.1 ribonuclease P [Candidatus Jingweiarchaeum tengchongense]
MKSKKRLIEKIALERINILLRLARENLKINPKRSARYVLLARKIAMRANIHIPKELKRMFCKNCNSILIPSLTLRVRLKRGKKRLVYTCLKCGKITRNPFGKRFK